MSNDNVYRIILENNTEESVAQKTGGAGGVGNQTGGSHGGQISGPATASKAAKAVFGVHAVASIGMNILEGYVSTVELRTGSSLAQQKATFWYNSAQRLMGFAQAGMSGYAFGKMFGGAGGAGGLAAFNALVNGMNQGVDFLQRMYVYNMQKKLEQVAQDLSAQRETTSGSRYQGAGQI